MSFKAGKIEDDLFVNSMAEAIEDEFKDLWEQEHNSPLPSAGKNDRRMLFVAVARGVLKHLKAHEGDGFKSVKFTGVATSYSIDELELDVSDI